MPLDPTPAFGGAGRPEESFEYMSTRNYIRAIAGRGLTAALCLGLSSAALADPPSVARRWNDLLLESIRNYRARPVVHARNLFHISAAMWDAWAVFEDGPTPWLVDDEVVPAKDVTTAREQAMSYAAYNMLRQRFDDSPGFDEMSPQYDALMIELGLDPAFGGTTGDDPRAVGNRIAGQYVFFGYFDGSNEIVDYANQWYAPINEPLLPPEPGTNGIEFPQRWQPLALDYFVDQSGNTEINGYPPFLGPEWGKVTPFSLRADQRNDYTRDGFPYMVYVDPGEPPRLGTDREDFFLEGF